jgi:hypothetical protein
MLDTFVALTIQFVSLLGVAALVAVLVNTLKVVGVIKDGTAAYWASGLGLAAFVTVAVLGIFRPDLSLVFLDQAALKIATVLTFILGFITQIAAAPLFHRALSAGSIPVIGKTFSS